VEDPIDLKLCRFCTRHDGGGLDWLPVLCARVQWSVSRLLCVCVCARVLDHGPASLPSHGNERVPVDKFVISNQPSPICTTYLAISLSNGI
jgi:hypothetical protein